MLLPALTLSVIPTGIIARTVRSQVADILSQEFIVGLRARGLNESRIFVHVMKNAAPTALAVMGLQVGYLMGGSILVETVFSWPGTGLLLNTAIFQRDLPLLQGTIWVLALFFVLLNLLVDILQTTLDPRIKEELTMVDTATTKAVPAAAAHATRQGYWRGVLRRLLRDPGGVVVGVVILLLLALALFGPWLIVKDPYQTSMFLRLKPIGSDGFPLGSDELGRDMLSRLILGTRLSLFMGIVPVVFAFFIGGAIGIIAQLYGRQNQYRDYAHRGCVLCLSLRPAGDCAVGSVGGGHRQCAVVADPRVCPAGGADCRERDRPGAAYGLYRRRPGHWRQRVDHYPRPGVGQRARADLRLLHRADFGVHDPRLRPVVSRPRRAAAGA